ncbi:site-specific integrase [Pseudomonas sp. 5P_3.1_Bac2]|uniref:site-specific integrase n=1 Tax=Pseudomonas sp. 5P_3.1_Bac2 TaxID=2971617 RepID=UPI0021C8695A|nr:site-specific integrase [Pseudomonas sp. 5P_3.1_Bac2]MCU1718689.1 site-specific integrase [Pseudomonas sp. 5P_3.1_Bac2]
MGTITQRKNKSGQTKYTAQIRLRRGGVVVYQESQTFERKASAQAWVKRRETELAVPGALARATRQAVSLREIIEQYLAEYEVIRPLGKTKRATLQALAQSWLGDLADVDISSQRLVEYAQWRMSPQGGAVQAQTVGNDLSHLGAVLSVARPAWGYSIDPHAMSDARHVLRKLGMVSRSRERNRRPTREELELLLGHFSEMQQRRPSSINMLKVVGFALFSTRRQDEICRIRWSDLDPNRQAVLVRDMKNPGQKIGNDVWCHLPPEAWAIVQSMPRATEAIFPYHGDSVSAAWTRACKFLGIDDLHFHDLRHEGVSRLFELEWDIPRVASVSGHRDWNSLRRYTHLRGAGDAYQDWPWLTRIIESPVDLGARLPTPGELLHRQRRAERLQRLKRK